MKEQKKVLIVEDEIIVATDVRMMLEANGYTVTGTARKYDEAVNLFKYQIPDLILCDIDLKSSRNGINFIQKVRELSKVPVIYMTAYTDDETLEEALETKPEAYLAKPFNETQLLISIKRVLKNGESNGSTHHQLFEVAPTKRELEVIKLIAKGCTTKEIAKELSISFETVQSHRKNILHKFKISSSAELISVAFNNNWVN